MFAFMTNHTPKNYIAERRMMLVYQRLITEENFSYNEAYWLSGVDSQKGFIDKFKRVFAITPDVAKKQRDVTQLLPPKTWDLISDNFAHQLCEISFDNSSEKRFGLDLDKYTNAILATNLMEYYGLNQLEADIAFEIAENNSLDFESVFEYVYGYVWQYVDPLPESEEETDMSDIPHPTPADRDARLKIDLTNLEVINLYFNCGLSFSEIYNVLYLRAMGEIKVSLADTDEIRIKTEIEQYQQRLEKINQAWDDYYNEGCDEPDYDPDDYYPGYSSEEDFDYYESLEEDDPERVEFEMALTEPEDELDYWEHSWDAAEYKEIECDLDKKYNYERLCNEVEQGRAHYRGNPKRMMPVGLYDLNADKVAKDELIRHIIYTEIGEYGTELRLRDSVDTDFLEDINNSKFTYEELKEYFPEYEKNYRQEEQKRLEKCKKEQELLEKKKKEAEETIELTEWVSKRYKNNVKKTVQNNLLPNGKKPWKEHLADINEIIRRDKIRDQLMRDMKIVNCEIIESHDSYKALVKYTDGHQELVDIRGCFENGHISLDEETQTEQ